MARGRPGRPSSPPAQEREDVVTAIAGALASERPHYSAFRRLSSTQMVAIYILISACLVALTIAPRVFASFCVATLATVFFAGSVYKAFVFLIGAAPGRHTTGPPIPDAELPIYTILVPLYRERDVLPVLLRALDAIDYPPDRLDIKLIAEDDDPETLEALASAPLASHVAVLRVPAVGPRTKPKALAVALTQARGAFVVVFDAEDQPEPMQLRMALQRFRELGSQTACLQARLNFFNARENWLTHLFALDYCLWFDALLRGLERIGAPLPLGGTSNHFRTETLIGVGGWDPYNVTEDADLGFRLAREGFKVRTLDSTTYEEAPTRLSAWLAQRARWIKGYLQTYFVHMREPRRLLRETGWRGVIALHFLLLGTAVGGLASPFLWAMFLGWVITGSGPLSGFTGGALLFVSLFGLVAGNALLIFLSLLAPLRRGWLALVPYALTVPLYWLLISLAAWRALIEFVFRPFYWAKTPHGLTRCPPQSRPGKTMERTP